LRPEVSPLGLNFARSARRGEKMQSDRNAKFPSVRIDLDQVADLRSFSGPGFIEGRKNSLARSRVDSNVLLQEAADLLDRVERLGHRGKGLKHVDQVFERLQLDRNPRLSSARRDPHCVIE
jgi:hypothetical protein